MMERWEQIKSTDEIVVWMEDYSGDMIAIAQPAGYEFWNIYDSGDNVVEGRSLGPFSNFKQAKERVKEDVRI